MNDSTGNPHHFASTFECEADDWPDAPGRHPCIWAYIPLPQVLPLPDGFSIEATAPLEETILHLALTDLLYKCTVWQQDRLTSPLLDEMADVAEVVGRSMNVSQIDPPLPHPDPARIATTRTVLEVAVPASVSVRPDDIDAAISIAIEAARVLQVGLSTIGPTALRLLSRASMSPIVTVVKGELVATNDERGIIEERGAPSTHLWAGTSDLSLLGVRPPDLLPEVLEKLGPATEVFSIGSPFAAYADLRREISVQLHQDGNDRVAVVVAATAAEVLLDAILLHLLWQEHLPPPEAAHLLDQTRGHKNRVLTHLPSRLGGNWDPTGNSPVGRYFTNVVELRHRVVHAGFVPSREAALLAQRVIQDLEQFVGDQLASDKVRTRYPRTAIALLGKEGLQRRKVFSNRLRQLGEDPAEPDWIESFARYQRLVGFETGSDAPTPGTDSSTLSVYVELDSETFLVRDRWTLMAAEAPNGQEWLSEAQKASLEQAAKASSQVGPSLMQVLPMELPDMRNLDWRPEAELFPELGFWPGTKTAAPKSANGSNVAR